MFETSQPEFLLLQPEDIRAALFELTHPDSHIMVRDAADREVAAVILGVDRKTGFFFWRPRDYAGTHFGRQRNGDMFTGAVFHFAATGYGGVHMHFRVPRPETVNFEDGSVALFSPLPERMSRVQRRKMFRASLANSPVRCTAAWRAAGATQTLQFWLRDISIEGVGLRCAYKVDDLPRRGEIMRSVKLHFGELGTLNVDLAVRNRYPIAGQAMSPDPAASAPTLWVPVTTPPAAPQADRVAAQATDEIESHLGAVISGLSARDEVWLQQMVWRLEKMRGARVDGVTH